MTFSFSHPVAALAALLFPFCVLLARRILRKRGFRHLLTVDISLGPPGGEAFRGSWGLLALTRALGFMEAAGCTLLLLAAAGPEVVRTDVVYLNRGADIIFILDISPSMAGQDMSGFLPRDASLDRPLSGGGVSSRFEAAHSLIQEFALSRPTDAVGLVAVGSEAALLLPPTTDRAALLERLSSLRLGELGDGTALGMGLAIAALHLRRGAAVAGAGAGAGPRPVAILITDGENNAGAVHPETAARLLAQSGAAVYVIGLGSGGEVAIDYTDPRTNIRRTGSFDSHFDTASLRSLALAADGVYLEAPSAAAFTAAFERLNETEVSVTRTSRQSRRESALSPFLLAALLLIGASRLIRRWFLGALL